MFELEPLSVFSACWRGYFASFALIDNRLVLDALDVSLLKRTQGKGKPPSYLQLLGPTINGVAPEGPPEGDKVRAFNNHYRGLAYHLDYSGGLLLAEGFIRQLYVHMGFHPAWKYENVIELVFQNGRLVSESDKSSEIANVRARAAAGPGDRGDIAAWVERCFDRNYGVK